MRVLSCQEIEYVNGGLDSPDENAPLRAYLKTRGACGALAFGMLMAPGGYSFIALGATLGLGVGLSYGYVEWLTWE